MSQFIDKQSIRKTALAKRRSMPADMLKKYSKGITQNLLAYLEAREFTSVHVYISYKNEPDTLAFIERMLVLGVELYSPVIRDDIMYCARVREMDFVSGGYGILEPKNPEIVPANTKYDVIIVPTLAFDAHNNRMGYGKGFYDRFLATQNQALKIGLCYSFNKVIDIPTEIHDIPLDAIITE